MQENSETIGQRIRRLRNKLGCSQERLAEFLMIKQTTLSKYEKDLRSIPPEIISMICKFFETTPTYLMWGVEDKLYAVEDKIFSEITVIYENISNPKIKEAALKQLKILAELDDHYPYG